MTTRLSTIRTMPTGRGAMPDFPPAPAFMSHPDRGCAPGKCDPDDFFSEEPHERAVAKKICRPCDFREECGTWAAETDQKFGIWAGINRNSNTARAERAKRRQADAS